VIAQKGKSPQSKGAKEKRKVNYMKTNAEIETLLTEIEGRQQRWFDGTTQERSELSRPLIIEDFPALVKLVRELMQQLDSLRRVGGTMANVMYNVKQRSPLVITEREREIIAALQQEWDLLSRSVPQEDKQ
jgi:hypothetical protein